MTDANSLLADLAEVGALRLVVQEARSRFEVAREGSRSGYDAAFANLCKALARFNRRSGEVTRRLGLEGV